MRRRLDAVERATDDAVSLDGQLNAAGLSVAEAVAVAVAVAVGVGVGDDGTAGVEWLPPPPQAEITTAAAHKHANPRTEDRRRFKRNTPDIIPFHHLAAS